MDARVKQLVNMIEDDQPVAVAVLAKRLEVSERAVKTISIAQTTSLRGLHASLAAKGNIVSMLHMQMSLLAC